MDVAAISIVVTITIVIVPRVLIVVVAAVTMHHHDVVGDGNKRTTGDANGRQTIAVNNTDGSPAVLYSNAARFAARLGDLVGAIDSLTAALRRRWRGTAILRLVQRRFHPILYVVGQSSRQRARVQLIKLDQL